MKNSSSTNCECGHEKRDHSLPLMGMQGYGECKVCLCDHYEKAGARALDEGVKVGQP